MLSSYILTKLKQSKYKLLDDGTYFGDIPSIKGVWANAKTLEACREELQSVLESWIVLSLTKEKSIRGIAIPKKFAHA